MTGAYKKFLKDTSGNVAMLFSVASVSILGAIGMAVDYHGIREAQTQLQGQVDAAVLALGKSGADTEAERMEIVMGSMVANGYDASGPVPVITIKEDGSISVAGGMKYDAMLMGMFGKDIVNVNASAESMVAKEFDVELTMVLDLTESMRGAKMDTLRTAATDLVSTIAIYKNSGVKIGLVPFANYVNVGMANRNQSWIDVPADTSVTETYTHQPTTQTSPGSCSGSETYTYEADGVTRTGTRGTGCVGATYVNSGPPETRTRVVETKWHGCVGSRTDPLYRRDQGYVTPVPGLMNVTCRQPIVPLTEDYASLNSAIAGMSVGGNTYMPAGLMWGWRVLSPKAPFSEGKDKTKTKKIMIVMTDGINTLKVDGKFHNNASTEERLDTNEDTRKICNKIGRNDIEVYTVAFQVPDKETKKLLKKCATDKSQYFEAENNAQLISAFKNIAARIINVRLTN